MLLRLGLELSFFYLPNCDKYFSKSLSSSSESEFVNPPGIMDANNQIINVPNEDIAKLFISPISMMPGGLTNSLSEDELRDLLKYLSQLGK
ncbi:MAG: hypothetical protein AAGD28_24275 [Bacteroidota bacterium]